VKLLNFEEIEPSTSDEKFRKAVKEAIDSAKNEVVVITGELGSYRFPELKQAAQQALDRGVKIKVYATEAAPSDDVAEIIKSGGELYIGKIRANNHYLVIDKKMVIVSEKEGIEAPTKIGTRIARLYKDKPVEAKRIVTFLNDLIRRDFMERLKEKSTLMKFADAIFSAFIPDYAKLPIEPKINE